MNRFLVGLAVFFLCCVPLTAFAESDLAADDSGQALDDYGEAGAALAYDTDQARLGHVSLGPLNEPLNDYFDFKQGLKSRWGLNYTIEIAPQYQWDWAGSAGTTSNNETNLIVQWSPIDSGVERSGNLLVWYQLADTLGSQTTSKYMTALGVVSPVNGGDTAPDRHARRLQHLSWESWFLKQKLRVQFGKLTTRTFLNLNRYTVGDREDFFSPMLVNNPAAPYTARIALGAFTKYDANQFSLLFMVRDADGTSEGLETELSGDWEYAVELNVHPADLLGMGKGNYRFTLYHTDAIGDPGSGPPSGWNASVSFDQDLNRRLGAALRYSYSSEDFRTFKERVALALQIKQPLGFANDRIGFGVWWGRSGAGGFGEEAGLETFWKVQLTRFAELTAQLQFIPKPALDSGRDGAFGGGLRLRLVL